MKDFIFYTLSVIVIGVAFYLRTTEGSAGMFSILAIPAMFYIMIQTPYIVKDTYNELNRRMLNEKR